MKLAPRPLLILHADTGFQQRVREAAGSDFRDRVIDDWESLHQAVASAPPAAVVVVDPFQADGTLSSALRDLLADFPSTSLIAAFEVTPERAPEVRTLGSWNVVDVISLGHDDTPAAIGRRLRAAQGRQLQRRVGNALPSETPGRARALLEAAAATVSAGGQGIDLAESLNLSRRTLLRWSERAELPPPRRTLAWMRILLAASLLDDAGRTVLGVARACGYSSDSGLRRVLQRFLGTSASELRNGHAFETAAAAFLAELDFSSAGRDMPPSLAFGSEGAAALT
jgi:AraC-like DNA-binding protein